MEALYDYTFHYNHFTKLWNAIPRDVHSQYWSDKDAYGVMSSKSIKALIQLISKGQDFINSIYEEN